MHSIHTVAWTWQTSAHHVHSSTCDPLHFREWKSTPGGAQPKQRPPIRRSPPYAAEKLKLIPSSRTTQYIHTFYSPPGDCSSCFSPATTHLQTTPRTSSRKPSAGHGQGRRRSSVRASRATTGCCPTTCGKCARRTTTCNRTPCTIWRRDFGRLDGHYQSHKRPITGVADFLGSGSRGPTCFRQRM